MRTSYSDLLDGLGFADRARLPADRRELPVVARPVHHHHRAARRAGRASCCSCSSPRTTLSVPALMGAIMCMGVATANSILVVSLRPGAAGRARRRACDGGDRGRLHALPPGAHDGAGHDHRHGADGAGRSARAASRTRRSAAPSSAACCCATVATLVFVPAVFALLHGRRPGPREPRPRDRQSRTPAQRRRQNRRRAPTPRRAIAVREPRRPRLGCSSCSASLAAIALGLGIYSGIRDSARGRRDAPAGHGGRGDPRRERRASDAEARRPRRSSLPGTTQAFTDAPIYRAHQRLPEAAGTSTSARTSSRASSWPRSRRPRSTSSSARPGPISRPRRRTSGLPRSPRRAGRRC